MPVETTDTHALVREHNTVLAERDRLREALTRIVAELERLSSEKWELAEQIGKDRPEHAAYVTFHGEASAYRHASGIVRRIGGLDG